MPLEDRIEKTPDPNAPKVFDLQKCQRLIRTAPSHARFPLGDVIQDMADQLKCAVEELGTVSTKIANAESLAVRYKSECETANAEVRALQVALNKAREEAGALKQQQAAALTTAPTNAPGAEGSPKPRRRGAKVVPMTEPKAAQG